VLVLGLADNHYAHKAPFTGCVPRIRFRTPRLHARSQRKA